MNTKVRLYFSDKIQSDLVAHIKKEQFHYLKDVMRLKVGDIFSVFNSQGEWSAIIQDYEKQVVKIKILEKLRDKKNENLPHTTMLNTTRSDIVGELVYNVNNFKSDKISK